MFIYRKKFNSYKTVAQCEFPAFCVAVQEAASKGRHCRKKIMCFFSPMVFLLSKGSEPFSLKHKRCAVREANGSICPDSVLFFFLCSISSIVAYRKKRFKWHLTLTLYLQQTWPTAAKPTIFSSCIYDHICILYFYHFF